MRKFAVILLLPALALVQTPPGGGPYRMPKQAIANDGATGPVGPAGPIGATGAPGSADAWGKSGTVGSDPVINFIGTTDAQPFVI